MEFSEHRFVGQCAEHTDGVVIPLGFDTSSQPGAGVPPVVRSRLKPAALDARTPFLIDLETWRLPYLTGRDDRTLERDAATVVAQAVPLPLGAKSLDEAQALLSLVRAGMSAQVGAEVTFAPDFQFESLDDPWLDVNLRGLVMTRTLAGARPVGAWIHVTLETMLSGTLALVVERYAARLAPGATVALTVSDMQPTLTPYELTTYFRALEAFHGAGLRVIVDRAGDATIPAAGLFADGCILGTRLYQQRLRPRTSRASTTRGSSSNTSLASRGVVCRATSPGNAMRRVALLIVIIAAVTRCTPPGAKGTCRFGCTAPMSCAQLFGGPIASAEQYFWPNGATRNSRICGAGLRRSRWPASAAKRRRPTLRAAGSHARRLSPTSRILPAPLADER